MHFTPKQKKVFLYIKSYIKKHNISPTYQVILKSWVLVVGLMRKNIFEVFAVESTIFTKEHGQTKFVHATHKFVCGL